MRYLSPPQLCIVAFPCNQFGQQEPEPIGEIMGKVPQNHGFQGRIFEEKVDIKGPNAHKLWKFLDEHAPGQKGHITWNFGKSLVGEERNMP